MTPPRRRLAALLVAAATATLVLWPGILSPRTALIGHESLDVWSHAWGQHWFVSELARGRLPWTVTGAAWPAERVHWFIDPLGALLTAPLQLLHPALAYNGLLFVEVAALSLCGHAWGRSLGGRGWLAGAALATLPLIQGELHNGVSEAVWLAPVALSGALAARGSRWTGAAVGVSLALTPYHGIGAALLVAAVTLMGGPPGAADPPPWPRRLGRLALAAALAAAVAAPFLVTLREAVSSTLAFVNRPFSAGWSWPSLYSNAIDPRALVAPGDFWSVPGDDGPLSAHWRRTPYLGLGLLACAGVGLARAPRAWPVAAAAVALVVATLGHFLFFDGSWVQTPAGGKYQLPLGIITESLHLNLGHPMRFAGAASVALAGLADRGVGRLGALFAPLVVVEHLLLAPAAWPIATSPAGLPPVHQGLPDDGRAVIDLPADYGYGMRTDRYLYWNALHGRPVPWNNRVGSTGTASMNDALRSMVLLGRERPMTPGSPGVPAADADLDAALAELSRAGLGWVVLHPDLARDDGVLRTHKAALTALLGPGEARDGAWVWAVPPP